MAAGLGVKLYEDPWEMNKVGAQTDHPPSMLYDIRRKLRTEIDFLRGDCSRSRPRIPAPLHTALYRLIKGKKNRGPTRAKARGREVIRGASWHIRSIRKMATRPANAGRNDLDAVVVRAPDNVLYLTNYWTMKGYDLAIFPREGDPTLLVIEPQFHAKHSAPPEQGALFPFYHPKDPRRR